MYLITDTTGRALSLGDRSLQEGAGQVRVSLLDTEIAAVDHARTTRDQAGADYLAAVQARTAATTTADLAALDSAATTAQRALTGAQIAASQAEEALTSATAALFAAFEAAQQAASKSFGDRGEVWWDGTAFQPRQAAPDPVATQRATDLTTLRAAAQADPTFAALLRVLGL